MLPRSLTSLTRGGNSPHHPASLLRHPGRRGLSGVGLVGLPNIGKSTLFNALVRQQLAKAANYPFATIDPQTASTIIPDPRLASLAALNNSEKVTPQTIDVVDIAGLIKGASQGEGLGNAFLGNVRDTSAILQVVRCFQGSGGSGGEDIIHVHDTVDPVRDISILETELALADLQSIEKRLGSAGKAARARTPEAAVVARLLEASRSLLEEGLPASLLEATLPPSERSMWPRLQLLTQKPLMYVCNVGEADVRTGRNELTDAVKAHAAARGAQLRSRGGLSPGAPPPSPCTVAVVCAKLEAELAPLPDGERLEYLAEFGLRESGMDGVLQALARLLRLQVFYTSGRTESRAWPIPVGATAVEAAGVIHTAMAKGFIKAEVTAFGDYVAAGGEKGAREAAKTRAEGKEYVMQDGDVVLFRFNG